MRRDILTKSEKGKNFLRTIWPAKDLKFSEIAEIEQLSKIDAICAFFYAGVAIGAEIERAKRK